MTDAETVVLMVEDNPGDARLVRALLSEAPGRRFRIEHVEQLRDALSRLDAGGIDVVLLDLSLPDSEGRATVEEVCSRDVLVPVVVYTGFSDERKAGDALRKGAESVVVKGRPGAGPLLSETLLNAVARRRARDTAQQASESLSGVMQDLLSALEQLPVSDPARPGLDRARETTLRVLDLLQRIRS